MASHAIGQVMVQVRGNGALAAPWPGYWQCMAWAAPCKYDLAGEIAYKYYGDCTVTLAYITAILRTLILQTRNIAMP